MTAESARTGADAAGADAAAAAPAAGPRAPAPIRPVPLSVKGLSGIAVLACTVLLVNANIFVARHYTRWDWTTNKLYTLSEPTLQTLHELQETTRVLVFLANGDPLTASVRHLLETYRAESRWLETRFIDPDQQPAEFLALQEKYRLSAGRSEEGEVVANTAIVVERADQHWFISSDSLVRFDEESGRAESQLEQQLSEALRQVQQRKKTRVCVSTGFGERSVSDAAPDGLAEFYQRLLRNNYDVTSLDVAAAMPPSLSVCELVLIAGPRRPYPSRFAEQLAAHVRSGGKLFLLVDPSLEKNASNGALGLDVVLALAHVTLGNQLVLERDPKARLAQGVGENFFAESERHVITDGLFATGGASPRLLFSLAQSVLVDADGRAQPLAKSSAKAFAIGDFERLLQPDPPEPTKQSARGPFTLAAAVELEAAHQEAPPQPGVNLPSGNPRLVIVGTSNIVASRNWMDPTFYGNRLFAENAIAWLAAQPKLVSVPEKTEQTIGLSLSEANLGEIWRYVLLYMPGTAALLGALILYRRHRGSGFTKLESAPEEVP